jgi:regulator of sigma E protease
MLLTILYFALILGVIVFVHEFGHFFFAKLFGIYVYEFSLGMGPKIFQKKGKNGETVYSLRAIPIGGFCSLAGEGSDEDKKLPKDRLLQSKPVWQRFLVMFFGAGNNFLLALIVLFFIGLVAGAPIDKQPIIKEVTANSPAEVAGLLPGDIIVSVDGNKVKTYEEMQLYLYMVKDHAELGVMRDGKEEIIKVTPLTEEEKKEQQKDYSYGFSFDSKIEYEHGFFNAIKYSFRRFGALVKQMVLTFKGLFTGGISVKELSGPVGIFSAVDQTKSSGISNIFGLLALLSLNVGFVNLIPFPAFDGGRILFLLIEKIKGKPVKAETENLIHTIGFFILIALIIFVTINDIIRLT